VFGRVLQPVVPVDRSGAAGSGIDAGNVSLSLDPGPSLTLQAVGGCQNRR